MTTTVLLALIKKLEGKVDSLETVSFEPVTELPETGEPNIIYLVPKSNPETGNYSDEYIWDSDNQTYEKIGDTQITPESDIIYFEYEYQQGGLYTLANGKTANDIVNALNDGKYPVLFKKSQSSGTMDYYFSISSYFRTNNKKVTFLGISGINPTVYTKIETSTSLSSSILSISSFGYFDSSLNSTSQNAPQTKAVKAALDLKANASDIPADYAKDTAVTALYDSTATYELGDIVMYNKELYECTTAIPVAEAWDSTHWTKTDIFSQMPVIPPIPADANHNIASAYDSTATYDLGDLCIYDGDLYECTTAISTAEEWTAAHWTQKTVAQELAGAGGSDIVAFDCDRNNGTYRLTLKNNKTITDIKTVLNSGKNVCLNELDVNGSLRRVYYFCGIENIYTSGTGQTSITAMIFRNDFNDRAGSGGATEVGNLHFRYVYANFSSAVNTFTDFNSTANKIESISKAYFDFGNYFKNTVVENDANGSPKHFNLSAANIADLYDSTLTYNSGDLAVSLEDHKVYKCNTDNTTGTWDSTKWDQVTVEDLLNAIPALPTVTSADAGKVLMVDSNGNWVAAELPDGSSTPYPLSGNGDTVSNLNTDISVEDVT